MKKIIYLLISIMVVGTLGACGTDDTAGDTDANVQASETINIVTTIFPIYDWTSEIIGDVEGVDLTMLIDTGVDLHSYQATTDDIIAIETCDILIYVGGESDEWVEDVLANTTNTTMTVINLIDVLGSDAKIEEMVEGMEESEHDHDSDTEEAEEDHDHDADEEEAEEEEVDEHIWLSLNNAITLSTQISTTLSAVDASNASEYSANLASYTADLSDLDSQYSAAVEAGNFDTILVADRFALRYLVDDYNISYYAAFVGCSAETEASFETIVFLANKVDELNLTHVLILEDSDGAIAQTVVSNTATADQGVLVFNTMQSITADDVAAGASYLQIMEDNLEVLKEALE